jgi:hypothetical protein
MDVFATVTQAFGASVIIQDDTSRLKVTCTTVRAMSFPFFTNCSTRYMLCPLLADDHLYTQPQQPEFFLSHIFRH